MEIRPSYLLQNTGFLIIFLANRSRFYIFNKLGLIMFKYLCLCNWSRWRLLSKMYVLRGTFGWVLAQRIFIIQPSILILWLHYIQLNQCVEEFSRILLLEKLTNTVVALGLRCQIGTVPRNVLWRAILPILYPFGSNSDLWSVSGMRCPEEGRSYLKWLSWKQSTPP